MSNDESVFSFELNESLYFEKGQEVSEMLGVSLEPEISIQPFHEYISVRGVIELHGAYQKVTFSDDEPDDDTYEFDDYHSKRYVEKVVDTDSGQSEFTHQFPVEISVPTYRVTNLNDVTVAIESFDYEIPNQSQLRLSATIEIYGIDNQTEEEDTYEEESVDETAFLKREDDTFEFDIKESKEEEPEEPTETGSFTSEDVPLLDPEIEKDEPDENTEVKERWKSKKSQTLAEFFNKEEIKEEVQEPLVEESSEEPPSQLDITESTYVDEDYEKDSETIEDVRYLSDMFRNSEEEGYAKMRLCIVQQTDTVETIAERYEISTGQIVKRNHLSDEDLEEGQLLYIPYSKN